MEAMPPNVGPASSPTLDRSMYSAAIRHPVFFTTGYIKPPFRLPVMPSSGFNPAATGYVFGQRNLHASQEMPPKL